MKCIIQKPYYSATSLLLRALLISQVAVSNSSTISMAGKAAKMKAELYFVRHGETEANRDGILQGHCDFPLTERGLKQCEEVGEALRSMRWAKVFSSDLPRTLHTSRILLSKSDKYDPAGKGKLVEDPLLREVNFGVKEMLPRDTTFEAAVEAVAIREGIRREDVVDNAETNAELQNRQHRFLSETVFKELKTLTESKVGNSDTAGNVENTDDAADIFFDSGSKNVPKILCVSHGGFIRRFLSNFCDLTYVPNPDSEAYPGSSILSSVFGIKATKLIRLSNCSVSIVTIEWAEGALEENYVCTAAADNVNIITHLKDP